jgi:predicted CopG family antitoxin
MHTPCLRVNPQIKERLDKLKIHPRESYNDVIERLLSMTVDNEPLTQEELAGVYESLQEFKSGYSITHEQIKKDLGLL